MEALSPDGRLALQPGPGMTALIEISMLPREGVMAATNKARGDPRFRTIKRLFSESFNEGRPSICFMSVYAQLNF